MTRFFDVFLSALALLILIPILLPIMLVLRLTGEGYVFYAQKRVGKGARLFNLLKFATMLKNSPSLGSGHITLKNDPRVLPIGRFLRKSKINELPQLFNILKGDMSIVGPRPLTEKNFNYYSASERQALSSVRPGLTGVGSIIFRDEERYLSKQQYPVGYYRVVIAPHKAKLELWHLEHRSLLMYFKLIALTCLVVAFPKSKMIDHWLVGRPDMPEELQ